MIHLRSNPTREDFYNLFNRLHHKSPTEEVTFRGYVGYLVNSTLSESIHKPETNWELEINVGGEVKKFTGSYPGPMPPPVPPPRTRFERDDVL